MWQHGEQAMAKALVASRLCQAMANEAADDDLDVEIYDELTNFGKEFEELGKLEIKFCCLGEGKSFIWFRFYSSSTFGRLLSSGR